MMTSIVPFNASQNAIALSNVVSGTFAALSQGHPIRGALAGLLLAFPTHSSRLSDEDLALKLNLYMRGMEGALVLAAIAALDHLTFNNPEAPFEPTPQAVREMCQTFDYRWWSCVADYMVGGKEWSPPKWAAGCPAPGAKGHPLALQHIRKVVKAMGSLVDSWGQYVHAFEEGGGRSAEEKFAQIRPEMFEDDEKQRILAKREAVLERKRRDYEEWLKGAERREAERLERERREQEEEARERAEQQARRTQVAAELAQMPKMDDETRMAFETRARLRWEEERAAASRRVRSKWR